MKTFTVYYVSWSPKISEATYSIPFSTAAERDKFVASIATISKSVHTWENECVEF